MSITYYVVRYRYGFPQEYAEHKEYFISKKNAEHKLKRIPFWFFWKKLEKRKMF